MPSKVAKGYSSRLSQFLQSPCISKALTKKHTNERAKIKTGHQIEII